eukprot:1145471-Pelagomonas_calceolata.AAC.7
MWDAAELDCDNALLVDPEHTKAMIRRAAARLELGKAEPALQADGTAGVLGCFCGATNVCSYMCTCTGVCIAVAYSIHEAAGDHVLVSWAAIDPNCIGKWPVP